MLHVTTAPTLLQTLTRRLRQSQCIIQLATGQQSGVRGDGSAAKLQADSAVELELQRGVGAFSGGRRPQAARPTADPPPPSLRRSRGRSRVSP